MSFFGYEGRKKRHEGRLDKLKREREREESYGKMREAEAKERKAIDAARGRGRGPSSGGGVSRAIDSIDKIGSFARAAEKRKKKQSGPFGF